MLIMIDLHKMTGACSGAGASSSCRSLFFAVATQAGTARSITQLPLHRSAFNATQRFEIRACYTTKSVPQRRPETCTPKKASFTTQKTARAPAPP